MNLTLSQCFVIVHDPEQALGLYRARPRAAQRRRQRRVPEDHRLRRLPARCLDRPHGLSEQHPGRCRSGRCPRHQAALNGVHFHADDLDAAFEKARGSGSEIVQEPTGQPWGTRDFAVRDPSGNPIRVDQPPAA